jgi:predicted PurR-regulated permease PerM
MEGTMTMSDRPAERDATLVRAGRRAWAGLGLVAVVVLGYLVLREVSVVATPLAVALFPAAVLWPVASWLRDRGLASTVVALVLLVSLIGLLGLAVWFVVPRVADEIPALADSIEEALSDLGEFVAQTPFTLPFEVGDGGLADMAQQAAGALGGGSDVVDQGLQVARTLGDLATAVVLFLVALFFYLRDGGRIWAGITSLLPENTRRHTERVSGQLFWTSAPTSAARWSSPSSTRWPSVSAWSSSACRSPCPWPC